MIPIHKLMKLPRHQSLRKICKIFTQAEQELSVSGDMAFPWDYLHEIVEVLIRDTEFSEQIANKLADYAKMMLVTSDKSDSVALSIRSINGIRHILLAETGQQTADWDFIDHFGNLDAQKRRIFPGMKVFLEDIRSPFNVGAMFRSAESFGVEKMLLSPLCADPHHPRAERTAMGCVSAVPWERIDLDKIEGPLFVLETGGTDMNDFNFPENGTMIVGSEELGAGPEALELAGKSLGRVSIHTFGAKGSLNVGTAFGIALQAWASHAAKRYFPA
jgi:TrmH family RNA methyltransferase